GDIENAVPIVIYGVVNGYKPSVVPPLLQRLLRDRFQIQGSSHSSQNRRARRNDDRIPNRRLYFFSAAKRVLENDFARSERHAIDGIRRPRRKHEAKQPER